MKSLHRLPRWRLASALVLLLALSLTAMPAFAQYYGYGGYYPYYGSNYGSYYGGTGSYYGGYSSYYGGSPYYGSSYYGGYPTYGSSYYGSSYYGYPGYGSSYYGSSYPYYGSSYYGSSYPYYGSYGSSSYGGYPYYGSTSGTYYGGYYGYPSYGGSYGYGYPGYGYGYPGYGYPYATSASANCATGTNQVGMYDSPPPGTYTPPNLSVARGTTVTWVNCGPYSQHSATSNVGVFDTGVLAPGQSGSFTFNDAGTFAYYCRVHGHNGTITVS